MWPGFGLIRCIHHFKKSLGGMTFIDLGERAGVDFRNSIFSDMQNSKPLIATLLSTIFFGLLSYFGFSPDPALASDTIAYADKAAQAISAKNWIMLGTTLFSFVSLVYVWWKGRSVPTSILVLALMATFLPWDSDGWRRSAPAPAPVSFQSSTDSCITITVVSPLPRFPLRC